MAGNSGSGLQMLNCASLTQPHMVLVINHDDIVREYDYRKTDLLKNRLTQNRQAEKLEDREDENRLCEGV